MQKLKQFACSLFFSYNYLLNSLISYKNIYTSIFFDAFEQKTHFSLMPFETSQFFLNITLIKLLTTISQYFSFNFNSILLLQFVADSSVGCSKFFRMTVRYFRVRKFIWKNVKNRKALNFYFFLHLSMYPVMTNLAQKNDSIKYLACVSLHSGTYNCKYKLIENGESIPKIAQNC